MSAVTDILDLLIEKKISIAKVEEELTIKAPKGAMTDELLNAIKENKASLVDYLKNHSDIENATDVPKIEKLQRNTRFGIPASSAQRRLWLIDRIAGGSSHYNMPMGFLVTGPFDLDLAERAIARIISRHEVLRTGLIERKGQLLQEIREDFDFSFSRYDLSTVAGHDQETQVEELTRNEFGRLFDLSRDLMVRGTFIKLSEEKEKCRGILLFNLHHIASDGWSMDLLVREFLSHYLSMERGASSPLLELTLQYADYAHWQTQWLQGELLEAQLRYWDKQLVDIPPVHGLTLDKARPKVKRHAGGQVVSKLSGEIGRELLALAKVQNITPFMLLHAALALVLSRHSNSNDIVVGTPVANRPEEELEALIGFFANTLVLRINTAYKTLSDYLQHVRRVHLDAHNNQDVPFDQLVERLDPFRTTSFTPLFQILLTTDTYYGLNGTETGDNRSISGIEFQPLSPSEVTAKFDLDIHATIQTDGVSLRWIYDKSVFEHSYIERISGHLAGLLTEFARSKGNEVELSALSMLSENEAKDLLQSLNGRAVNYQHSLLVHGLFESQVEKGPHNIAIVFNEGQLTYDELNSSANRLAHYLIEQGVRAETPVGICLGRSFDMVISILAVLKAGGAFIPIEPETPKGRLNYFFEVTNLEYIITESGVIATTDYTNELKAVIIDDGEMVDCLVNYSSQNPISAGKRNPHSLAYTIFTSGSTGHPKGVMLEHAAYVNFLYAMEEKLNTHVGGGYSLLAITAYTFDIATIEIFASLISGGKVILAAKRDTVDPVRLIEMLETHDIRYLQTTPAIWQLILDSGWQGKANLLALSCGEALPLNLARALYPRCERLLNGYGPTEATVYSLVTQITGGDLDEGKIRLGGPLHNYSHYVLDINQNLCPYGVVGELYIGGPSLARGYINKPELTNEHFVDLELWSSSSTRLYRTGDLVRYFASGDLEYIGRTDNQVKIRGIRIELEEIEHQLNQCPQVSSCLVLAQPGDSGEKRLVAYVIAHPASDSEKAVYIDDLKERLQLVLPIHMVPWIFVLLDQWPLNANGKVDRKALPEAQITREYCAVETPVQMELARIWADLLDIDEKQIGINSNFFEMGGHSLLAVKLVYEIQNCFLLHEVSFGIKEMFQYPVLITLADYLELLLVRQKNRSVASVVENYETIEEGEL